MDLIFRAISDPSVALLLTEWVHLMTREIVESEKSWASFSVVDGDEAVKVALLLGITQTLEGMGLKELGWAVAAPALIQIVIVLASIARQNFAEAIGRRRSRRRRPASCASSRRRRNLPKET